MNFLKLDIHFYLWMRATNMINFFYGIYTCVYLYPNFLI